MGDRGNINVDGVFLYAHWSGSYLPKILQDALAKRWRWTDGSYLCRIVYDCLVGKEFGKETGFGISVELGDNSHPILCVDTAHQTVTLRALPTNDDERDILCWPVLGTWTFEEFVQLTLTDGDQFAELRKQARPTKKTR